MKKVGYKRPTKNRRRVLWQLASVKLLIKVTMNMTLMTRAMTKVIMTKAIRGDSRATEGRKQGPVPINPKTEKRNEGTNLSTMAISPAVGRSDRQGK